MLLVPIAAFPQVARTPQIQTEQDLVAVLVSGRIKGPATSVVLRDHGNLVTKTLFDQLMAQAYLLSSQDPTKAELIYENARVVAEQMGNKKLVALSFFETGTLHFQRGKISLAKLNYLKSKQTLEQDGPSGDLVVVLSSLGNVCLYHDALNEAKEFSQQSIAMANSVKESEKPLLGLIEYGVAVSWLNLGDLAKRAGHYDEALTYSQKALESFKGLISIRPQYAADLADSLAEIGRVYRVKGEHRAALRYFNQALEIAKTLKLKDKLASVLNSISVLYLEQNDYLKASEYANQSLSVYREIGDRYEIARLLANQGVINQRQAKYVDALKSFQESLQNSDDTDAPDLVIAAQEGMGAVYQEQGDYRAALEWLDKAMALAQKLGNQTRQAELLWRLGEAYYLKGDLTKAQTHSASAANLASQLRLPIISYLALTAQGKYHLAENNYDLAFKTLSQAIEQVESIRDRVAGQEQGRQLFFDNKVVTYNLLVELFIKQNRPAEALLYAERAKGRVLLDVVRDGKADLAKTVTPAEKEEAHRLNQTILGLNERLSSEESKTSSDPNILNQLYAKRDTARIEYESYQDAVFAAHPDLNVRRGRTTPLTLKEVTTLTRTSETAYIEYVITKERVYLFALTGGGADDGPEIKVYPLTVKPDELAGKVEQFHQRLANRHPDFASIGRELYAALIEPASQQLRGSSTLCIVPDSFLWNLPFQALMTESNHYLFEDQGLYYAPSLTVLREMNKVRVGKEKREGSLLAFGNPIIGKDNQSNEELCPLPEAETEVASVAKTFGPHVNKVLIGREASEKTFRTLAPTFATIHLAAHGVLDNRHPLYSHLLLTKTQGDAENDGLLEAREIMNMNLDADLAVLSACETANGKIAPGEGVIGTSWAFFVAGTRSMLVSQWKVNSASTSKLMTNFYQGLSSKQTREGEKKASSLQEATLRLMIDDRYRHPFYWAGFILVGTN
jgi:CHAT domain-containing protein